VTLSTVMLSVFMLVRVCIVIDSIICVIVVVTEAAVGTEEEMLTTLLHRMTEDVVRGAGMLWKTTSAMTVEGPVAGGVEPAVVGRNGPGMTVVGVG